MVHRAASLRTAPWVVLSSLVLWGCSNETVTKPLDADKVVVPPNTDGFPGPPPGTKTKKGDIRSPKDGLLPDNP